MSRDRWCASRAAANQPEPLLTRKEVAGWLRVGERQVQRLGIPGVKMGHRTVMYQRGDVEAWIASHRTAAA